MNHCRLNFYCVSRHPEVFDAVKAVPALAPFTFTFTVSELLDPAPAAEADVILADLRDTDVPSTLQSLLSCKKEFTQLILLADLERFSLTAEQLSQVTDLWVMPITDDELRFRFLRWQQTFQLSRNQQLQHPEQLFHAFSAHLARSTDDMYMLLNADGTRLEYISPNLDRALGITPEELEKNILRMDEINGFDLKDVLRQLEPGESLEPREMERINRKTGEHKLFLETVCCVSLQGEKKILVYGSDRTREKNARDTLTQALDMAQAANRAKSDFLSGVSHDIRTPMDSIQGFITLMREEAGNRERVLEYAQQIEDASHQLLSLISDVLDMNKIESGMVTLNPGELCLADLIGEVNAVIRPQAKAREQDFEIRTSSLVHEHLIGDRPRIHQILINILSNAVKYTQKGGLIRMTVTELPQTAPDRARVRFSVADNGRGMSEAYQKVIFTPFSREQNAPANQLQGTGLGMSITKNLVDLMGGSIRVESQLGKGSTFTVELELPVEEKEKDPRFWEDHGVRRVIVADDDENVCSSILKTLLNAGVDARYATRGEEAVKMIRLAWEKGAPYDLLLLDWEMSGLNGPDTARLVREQKDCGKLPILPFTARAWPDIEKEAGEAGISHFLPKPFFMASFRNTVRRVMTDRSRRQAAPLSPKDVVRGKHILVVDDIEVNRMILVKILAALGAVCDTAENGQIAVDKFLASVPGEIDLIMMDIQMPVMDGYTATRTIRASGHPSAQSIPVVAVTANALVEDVREALKSGMNAHIAKPTVVDKMLATLYEVFEKREQ